MIPFPTAITLLIASNLLYCSTLFFGSKLTSIYWRKYFLVPLFANTSDTPSGTTITPNTDYETIYYTCDKAVKLLDDTIVNASDEILDVTNVVVEDNLTFTAHNRYIPLIKYQSDVGGIITGLTVFLSLSKYINPGTKESVVPKGYLL